MAMVPQVTEEFLPTQLSTKVFEKVTLPSHLQKNCLEMKLVPYDFVGDKAFPL